MADNKPTTVATAPAGENTPDVVYLGNKKVRARYKVRPSENGPQTTVETVFDYSGLTDEQLYNLANSTVVIRTQARLRDQIAANPKFDAAAFKSIDVLKDVVTASRDRDPVAAAVLAAQKAGVDAKTIELLRASALAAKAKK